MIHRRTQHSFLGAAFFCYNTDMPHINEKIDFVTGVFIVHGDRVLLRKHDKYKIWLPPGGHIELDEDPNQCAVREAKEEVGLDIILKNFDPINHHFKESTELIPPQFLHRHYVNEVHEHISFIYFATTTSDHIQQGSTEVSDEIRWFTKEDLDNPAFGVGDATTYYAKAALSALTQPSS